MASGKWEATSLVGKKLGQFEIKSEIARGGMGVVYKGYQSSLDRWVAIKTLPMDLAGDRELVMRFQREADAMVRLNHANIIQIIDRGQDQGQYYFAMEYVEGPSVKDLLKSDTIDTDKIFDILIQTCEGLEYAHKKGLVHRDVKPANLLYEDRTGVVKIADFGIAHFSKKDEDMLTLTAQNVGMGTMNYMAPEQKVDAGSVDFKADIYALGVIIYEAFTGKLPLGKFKLPSELNAKLPRELDAIVQRCLEADPKDRIESCGALKTLLIQAKAATHSKTIGRSVRDALDRTLTAVKKKQPLGLAVLGCAFLLLALGVGGGVALYVKVKADQKKVAAAKGEAEEARARATPLVITGGDGEPELKAADEAARTAASTGDWQKVKEQYEAAATKGRTARLGRVTQVEAALAALAPRLDALPEDGLRVADARSAVAEVKGAIARGKEAPEAFDPGPLQEKLRKVQGQIADAEKLAQEEKALREKIAKKPEGDEGRKSAEAELAKAVAARKAGDADGAYAALSAAGKALDASSKPIERPRPPDPVVVAPVNPTDPAAEKRARAVEALKLARPGADEAKSEARLVIREAARAGVSEGKPELDAATRLEDEVDPLAIDQPEQAYQKLLEAKRKFEAARDAGIAGLEAKVAEAKKAAEVAKDAREFAEGERQEQGARLAATPGERAGALAKAVASYQAASEQARRSGEQRYAERVQRVEQARAGAVARVGEGDRTLAAGDAAKSRADKLKASDPKQALLALDEALRAFTLAEPPPPKAAYWGDIKTHARPVIRLGVSRLDAAAGCAKGVVIASGQDVVCLGPNFDLVAKSEPGAIPKTIVNALCAGEGNEVYAAIGNPKSILKLTIGNSITSTQFLKTVDEPPLGLAYDRGSRRLYALSVRDVTVYTTDTDPPTQPCPPIPIRESYPGGVPRSIAALPDGSVVVVGQTESVETKEKDWVFLATQFRYDGRQWIRVSTRGTPPTPCAVAAVGDALLGVSHENGGKLLLWPNNPSGGVQIRDDPVVLPIQLGKDLPEKKIAQPLYATRLAVFGRRAWVLDVPPGENDTAANIAGNTSPFRKRIVLYDLRDK